MALERMARLEPRDGGIGEIRWFLSRDQALKAAGLSE